jgi:hypothetical protein
MTGHLPLFLMLAVIGPCLGADQAGPELIHFSSTRMSLHIKNTDENPRLSIPFTVNSIPGGPSINVVVGRSSCECTAAAPGKDVYAPGEAGVIYVHYDNSDVEGTKEIEIAIRAMTVDARQLRQSVALSLAIQVEPSIKMTPRRLSWGPGEDGQIKYFRAETLSDTLTLLKYELIGDGMTVVREKCSLTDHMAMIALKPSDPKQKAFVALRISAKSRSGDEREKIAFAVNEP